MSNRQIAEEVLAALGGPDNVRASEVHLTRLCVSVADAAKVDLEQLETIQSVLGVAREEDMFDIVFTSAVVDEVYEEFSRLTADTRPETPISGAEPIRPKVNIHISPGMRKSFDAQARALSALLDELPENDSGNPPTPRSRMRLLVINGPNINLLGMREPGIYGSDSYSDLVALCRSTAREMGFSECHCFQSNHEGAIVDEIQRARGNYDGIVINPAAYTHTSIALLDALNAVNIPAVEVHISKVEDREDFRQVSYVREACFKTITGKGLQGYAEAIGELAEYLHARR